MTPGCPAAPGVFSSVRQARPDRRHIAFISDWGVWGGWHAGKIWSARAGADQDGEHVPVRHATHQPDRMFFPRLDRAAFVEPRDCAARMAYGDRGRIFR